MAGNAAPDDYCARRPDLICGRWAERALYAIRVPTERLLRARAWRRQRPICVGAH